MTGKDIEIVTGCINRIAKAIELQNTEIQLLSEQINKTSDCILELTDIVKERTL